MFRCYFCNQITPAKTPRQSVIISKREKQYPTRRREAKGGRGGGGGRFRSREGAVQDQGGKGIEIAQEVSACPTCAAKHHEAEVIALPVEATPEVVTTAEATPGADATATPAAAAAVTPAAEATPAASEAAPEKAAEAAPAEEKAPEA